MSALSRLLCATPLVPAVLVVLGAMPGCDREDLVVATVAATDAADGSPSADDAGDDGGDANQSDGGTCFDDDDCPYSDERCEKKGCGTHGTCEVPSCDNPLTLGPSCGCNHVTYYNDCVREVEGNGVSELSPFQCGDDVAIHCSSDDECRGDGLPPNAICFRRVVGSHTCDMAQGTCWVVPDACDDVTSDGAFYRVCGEDSGPCLNLCQAVRSGQPVVSDVSCQP